MPAAPAPMAAQVPAHGTDTCLPPTEWWFLACELGPLPHLALCKGDIYGSFFLQQIDWYHQRMCVFCLGTRRTGGEERDGGWGSLFVPLLPNLSWELKPSVRKGCEECEWALDDYQTPTIHSNVHALLLLMHIHVCTAKHTHTHAPMAERWTSPDLTCSLICFRGDRLFMSRTCRMYCMCSRLRVSLSSNLSISQLQWLNTSVKTNKGNNQVFSPPLYPTLWRRVNRIISDFDVL